MKNTSLVSQKHRSVTLLICIVFAVIFWLGGGPTPGNIAFISALLIFSTWEYFSNGLIGGQPVGHNLASTGHRWSNRILSNMFLVLLNGPIAVYLILIADLSEAEPWSIFNLLGMPGWAQLVISFFLLDLCHYAVHVLHHKVKFLWRFHAVHHSDSNLDVTTAGREHPLYTVIIVFTKMAAIIAFGVPPLAIVIYTPIQIATSLFIHSNIHIPAGLDRVLRRVFVTPSLHYTHHSVDQVDTDSVYGSVFIFWDKLFGTFRSGPRSGMNGMVIGLDTLRSAYLNGLQLLFLPFLNWDRLNGKAVEAAARVRDRAA